MSDFLANLIRRSLAQAPSVEPRLPSRFEPTVSIGDPTGESGEGAPGPPSESVPATVHHTITVKPGGSVASQPQQEARLSPTNSPMAAVCLPAESQAAISSNPPQVPPALDPEPAEARRSGSGRNTALYQEERESTEPAAPVPRPSKQTEEALRPSPKHRNDRGLAGGNTVSPGPIRSSADFGILPSIRVTIGRIEVRATAAPVSIQPPVPAKPTVPKLSLDDYLTQRNGGLR